MRQHFHSWAQSNFMAQTIDLFFRSDIDGRRYAGLPVVFRVVEDGEEVDPTLRLSRDSAQELMDALWSAGLRPTEGSGSAGSLAATERHLADMRGILQKQGVL